MGKISALIESGDYIMSDKTEKKGIHFNLADRMFIENALFEHMPLLEIARRLGKDPTTVSKEIKRNRIENRSRVGKDYVLCLHYKGCRKMHLCKDSCSHLRKCLYVLSGPLLLQGKSRRCQLPGHLIKIKIGY